MYDQADDGHACIADGNVLYKIASATVPLQLENCALAVRLPGCGFGFWNQFGKLAMVT
jgi:hypothetical protein